MVQPLCLALQLQLEGGGLFLEIAELGAQFFKEGFVSLVLVGGRPNLQLRARAVREATDKIQDAGLSHRLPFLFSRLGHYHGWGAAVNPGANWVDVASFGLALILAIGGVVRFVIGRNDLLRDELTRNLDARTEDRVKSTGELHHRLDEVIETAANFREHVARDYATVSYMRDVEQRITASIGQSETRLTALLGKLEERLDRTMRSQGSA